MLKDTPFISVIPNSQATYSSTEMKKETVVLFPSLFMGHLIPMVELAKLFINHNLSVAIILIESPFKAASSSIDPFIARVSSAYPSISFHHLPKPEHPSPPPPGLIFHLIHLSNPFLSDFLNTLSQSSNIRALVLDMFCAGALDVANEFRIPSYVFFSSSASSLSAFLFIPTLQSQAEASFKDLGDRPLHIPGLPPIPASHMPDHMTDRDNEFDKAAVSNFARLSDADGIIINTFEALEPRGVQALVEGLCVPGRTMSRIYCIGPLIVDRSDEEEGKEKHECLKWLNAQPKGSVVFLCFGSMGSFSAEQLKEIANGLDKSGQRFLWVVRSPRSEDPKKQFEQLPDPDLDELMPEGFLERTEGRGIVVKSWAPQAAVLAHKSTAGFVSHCGWNSILEAVGAGVPIIAWPLYAEQKMNKVFLTEEAKLAVEMKGYNKGLVEAEEVEMKVKWLMESEGGKELKERAAKMKESAIAAQKEGGSSAKAWMELMSALC